MGRRAVEVEVVLFDVLAVVSLAVSKPEETLFEDGVLAVPQGQREAQPLLVVRDARQTILAPPVGTGAGVIVSEEVPGITIFAIVLAHRSPLPFTQVRPPLFPRYPISGLDKTPLLCVRIGFCHL